MTNGADRTGISYATRGKLIYFRIHGQWPAWALARSLELRCAHTEVLLRAGCLGNVCSRSCGGRAKLVSVFARCSASCGQSWIFAFSGLADREKAVLAAKGRAKVSVAASEADWSKRIREMQYADHEDHTTGS